MVSKHTVDALQYRVTAAEVRKMAQTAEAGSSTELLLLAERCERLAEQAKAEAAAVPD